MDYRQGLAVLESRAKLAVLALWIFIPFSALTAIGQLLEAIGLVNIDLDDGPLVMAVGFTYVAYIAVLIACVVIVSLWLYRAHANLVTAGVDGLEFTPGWAVGWYFIPIMNLFRPYRAMRELWTASHSEMDRFGDEAPSQLKMWWGAWIVGNMLNSVSGRIIASGGESGFAVGNALGAASAIPLALAAIVLMKIITEVTQTQRGGGSAVAVFA